MDDQKHLVVPEKADDEEGSSREKDVTVECKVSSFKLNVWYIFLKYLDRCTMTGVPFIRNAENKYVKAAWSLLLFSAIFVMLGHLTMLILSFLKYKTYSEVKYTFNSLPFPAVTICNVNPIRASKVSYAQDNIRKLIELINPDNLDDVLEMPALYLDNSTTSGDPGLQESSDIFDALFIGAFNKIFPPVPTHRGIPKKLHGKRKKSVWLKLLDNFKQLVAEIDLNTRFEIGHQLNDLILQCYYNGYNCERSCFRRMASLTFGNCYTIECESFYSYGSGPDRGLTLVLRIEMDEYIPTISESKGAQVIIHERNTLAFPDEDGIAVAAGSESLIGIRQVEVSRLQEPYGQCSSVDTFKNEYGVNPTRNTCIKVCQQLKIVRKCGCYDNVRQEINRILNISKNENPCKNDTELECVMKIDTRLSKRFDICGCNNPCNETKYEKTVSARQWPSESFAKVLTAGVCLKTPAACETLKNKTDRQLKGEYLKMNIYFEDLNYAKFSEIADYELINLVSDIGGTIGLWIGLSILGLCEVLHLLIELFFIIYRRFCSTQKEDKHIFG